MSALKASPKQLVVVSGKGGTGKTSIVAALATIVDNKVLADCDVDAADLHLVLGPTLKHREPFVAGKEARIVQQRCSACGLCMDHCRFGAIRLVGSAGDRYSYVVDPMACEGCGLCTHVCASGSVAMVDAERGEWFVSDTRHGPLVHARLNLGGENSGKLVTLVRSRASELARAMSAELVLVDGPPGIGCPVIASVTGVDLALAVTEPTVSGIHDLERAADLVSGFGLPLAVCVNKSDLNPQMTAHIRKVCADRGIPIAGEVSYDAAVVHAQVEGKSIVEHGGSVVVGQIQEMWNKLDTMLSKGTEA